MEKVFYNGKIITMAGDFPEAVWISGARIKMVGSIDSVKRSVSGMAPEWINLQGKCLMPSFIDSHSHIVMNGQMAAFADLSECGSFADIVSTLKEYIAGQKSGIARVAVGFGYDHNFLKEKCHPDRFVLDKVSTEIPIVILHISGHMGCMNIAALKMSGINENTDNPAGGRIGRVYGSNEPNGYVEEAGLAMARFAIQGKGDLNADAVMERMQKAYLENGITTAQDGASTDAELKVLKRMSDSQKLKIDVVSYPLISADGPGLMGKYRELNGIYKNHLKIGGYKIILDGSPQGRSAWLSEPYSIGEEGYCGYPALDDSTVKKYILQSLEEKRQILAHCNGDAASEQFLRVYEECISSRGKRQDLRPVMIHCQTVRSDQLDKMAKAGMIASMFIGHVWYWGDVHLENLGIKRGNYISPARDAATKGVIVNFHQDAPVTKPNMLHSVWCAVNRMSRGGQVVGREQRMNVYDALKAVTIHAAYQYFEEDEKGSIEVGKRADLVILDHSPLEVEAFEIKNIQVLETIKDGVTLYKRNAS